MAISRDDLDKDAQQFALQIPARIASEPRPLQIAVTESRSGSGGGLGSPPGGGSPSAPEAIGTETIFGSLNGQAAMLSVCVRGTWEAIQ